MRDYLSISRKRQNRMMDTKCQDPQTAASGRPKQLPASEIGRARARNEQSQTIVHSPMINVTALLGKRNDRQPQPSHFTSIFSRSLCLDLSPPASPPRARQQP